MKSILLSALSVGIFGCLPPIQDPQVTNPWQHLSGTL